MSHRAEDLRWMRRCLELAARGGRAVEPNPRVGALLVKDGRPIGEGWHRRIGGPHAEIEALAAASENPRGATLYVSLEPCHLQGRTPPCSEAILEAGLARVVFAMEDPNPAEAGRSAGLLIEAGIEVESGLMADQARALNPGYLSLQERGRPHVILKSAATLNGMLARADGSSRWITGEEARREGHRLRASVGAVALGAETVRLDRPVLDLRMIEDGDTPPRPVVFGGRGELGAPDPAWEGRSPILVLPEGRGGVDAAWTRLSVPEAEGGVDIAAALAALAGEGVASLLVEGGGRLFSAFLSSGQWDRWEHFLAPGLFPADGRPLWTRNIETSARIAGVKSLGKDLQISLVPEGGA